VVQNALRNGRNETIDGEVLMGHSTGISDSYYRATENELLEDYLKAVDFLTIDDTMAGAHL
jgi:hypothetical protein